MELDEIFTKLELKEGFHHGDSQNEESIKSVEKKLHLELPQSYKEFLKRYGFIRWNEGIIYGISKNLQYDVVHRDKLIREAIQPEEFMKLPKDAFLIKSYEDAFFMLFSKKSPREDQVALYLSEKPEAEEKNWKSFKFFLEDYCL